jgi:predicted transcriptional regulator YdeE
MRVMVIVKASPESEAGVLPDQALLTAMGNYNEELAKAGIILAGEGLHPTSKGKRVRFSGTQRTVIDGPFAETKELIAGYWMWKVASLDDAVAWLKKAPFDGGTEVEIRPIFEADEFGDAFTPELREQEAAVRAISMKLNAPRFANAPERIIAGFNATYAFNDTSNIPAQWDYFAPHIGKVPGQQGTETFGVSWNCTKNSFDYLAGVAVANDANLGSEYIAVRLPARRYAIFQHTGNIATIKTTFDTICNQWVPECGLKVANAPWLERYTEAFDPKTGDGGFEIWLPLE